MVEITRKPIDPVAIFEKINRSKAGSVVIHYGMVREDTSGEKRTSYIEFEESPETIRELEEVAADVKVEWPIEDIFIIRRMGKIAVGEIILATAVSAKNRHDASVACTKTIDRLKKLKTIRKKEIFA